MANYFASTGGRKAGYLGMDGRWPAIRRWVLGIGAYSTFPTIELYLKDLTVSFSFFLTILVLQQFSLEQLHILTQFLLYHLGINLGCAKTGRSQHLAD